MGDRRSGSDRFHADREQLDPIEQWAAQRGVRLDLLEPELGVSGGLPIEQRPSLRRAVEGVEDGSYAGIVVAYLSRLGRNVAEQLRVWDRVETAGGKVVTIREGVDTSTAAGRLHRNLLVSIDAHEREQHAERFEERRRLATAAGIWQRRQTPRGYDRDPRTRHLVANADAESVRQAARNFLAGAPMVQIAETLRMTPSGVRQMLRNRVYLGELKVGKHVNTTAHDPILALDTFNAVTARLNARIRPARSGREPALLAGLVRCVSCGHVMNRSLAGRQPGRQPTYICRGLHSGGRCPAPTGIECRRIEPFVEQVALGELRKLEATVASGDRLDAAQVAVDEAERELAAFLDAVEAAGISAADAAAAMRSRRERVDDARQALAAEIGRAPVLPRLVGGDEIWDQLSVHERNELLRGLACAVVVRPCGRGRKVPVAERVRVLRQGADVALPTLGGGARIGLCPLPFPDGDSDDVIGVPAGEDSP